MSSNRAVFSSNQALRFLANAGAELTGSLDYEETLRRVARLAVPDLADWCAVYISGEGEEEKEITSGHGDPEIEATLLEIRRRRRTAGISESRAVSGSGEARLASDVSAVFAGDVIGRERQLIERLGPTSYMVVPLVARGRSLGALTLLATREGRHYTEEDLAFARTLAARCGLAIDNARLYDAAERSLILLDTVFATAPVGLGVLDHELRFIRLNDMLGVLVGRPIEGCLDRLIAEVLDQDSDRELAALCRRVLNTGEAVRDQLVTAAAPQDAGAVWNVSVAPVHEPSGDRQLAGHTPGHVVETIEQAIVELQHGNLRDDVALLAIASLASSPGDR